MHRATMKIDRSPRFLGMTEDECAVWVMDARTLPMLLRASGGGDAVGGRDALP